MAVCYEFKLIFKFLSSCLCRRQYTFGDFQKQLQCFKSEKKKSLINIDFIKRMDNMVRHKQVAAKKYILLASIHFRWITSGLKRIILNHINLIFICLF